MKRIVVATHNEHKLKELAPPLEQLGYDVHSLKDFQTPPVVEETGDSFKENALKKARAVRLKTSAMVLADDSGLEVDALHGRPGVHSKRFSKAGTDEANNRRLLALMEDKRDRTATFRTVMVLIDEAGTAHVFEGELPGYIHTAEEGCEGFGYDPVFIPAGQSSTLAALGMEVKNRISHRRRCLAKVLAYLKTTE